MLGLIVIIFLVVAWKNGWLKNNGDDNIWH